MRFSRREPEPEKEWTIYEHEGLYFLVSPYGTVTGSGLKEKSEIERHRKSLNRTYRARAAYEREYGN